MINFDEVYEKPVLVGQGGCGEVYRLKNKETGEYVALKIMDNKQVWESEKKILTQADHPLFPAFIDADEDEGKYYILMEYIWGENLASVLMRRKGLAQAEAMRMALTIADGIGWLQTKDNPAIFRDLKAENIVLTPEGDVRLVDFGSACGLYDKDKAITGTAGVSAPEQFEGEAGLYSDVYAFGKLFHFMLTGINPSQNENKKLIPLYEFDPMLSYLLELLIEDCIGTLPEDRLPDMYCVTQRMVEIASQTPRSYKKMEKLAKKEIERRAGESEIAFEKNIRK